MQAKNHPSRSSLLTLALLLFLTAGCAAPDYRPTFAALDKALVVLRADYQAGRVSYPGLEDREVEEVNGSRLELIDEARATLEEASR